MTRTRTRTWSVWTAGALTLAISACGDQGPELPELPAFGQVRTVGDHREVEIAFDADGAVLRGTLYLPAAGTDHAAVAVSQGSSWTTRATWAEVGPFVLGLNAAVFSWDKRGAGASEGEFFLDADSAHFQVLARDQVAAARALAGAPGVRADRVGAMGTSQGGWIVPLAASLDRATIAFGVVLVGGAVSVGQDALYDELTGYVSCTRTATPIEEIVDSVYAAGPSVFDPRGSLEALTQPVAWIYGGMDMSHSAALSQRLLQEADPTGQKPWTIVTLPNANHALVEGGGICQETGPLADVLTPLAAWGAAVLGG